MPPADSHAKREFASLKGRLGSRVTLAKSNKRGSLGGLFFSGKARKECFSFHEKHIRDGFNVTFSLVRKSNQKVHQRVAALWTPGERFKTRAVEFQVKFETLSALRFFTKIC